MTVDPNEPAHRAVVYVEERINRVVDRFDKTLSPVWQANNQVAQTIIWLSGGALVLSVTLTQVFSDQGATVRWGFLLPVAWVLLALTVVVSLSRISRFMGMRSAPLQFEKRKNELRLYVRKVHQESNAGDLIDEKIEELWEAAWEIPRQEIDKHDKFAVFSAWTLMLGLAVLILFAILNVPIL